jgi:hypothetical protein
VKIQYRFEPWKISSEAESFISPTLQASAASIQAVQAYVITHPSVLCGGLAEHWR